MSHDLQDTIENFRHAMEEMEKKVATIRERTDEAYRKINQLEAQKYSLMDSNEKLSQELHNLSYQVALHENGRNSSEKIVHLPKKKGAFIVRK